MKTFEIAGNEYVDAAEAQAEIARLHTAAVVDAARVAELEAAQTWINAEDQFPEFDDTYLVTCRKANGQKTVTESQFETTDKNGSKGFRRAFVTHWMKKPQPAKGNQT